MAEEKQVLRNEQKDKLFAKLRAEPAFREMIKKDWRAALREVQIDPETVANGTLTREEYDNFAAQRAAGYIIIIIGLRNGLEQVSLGEAVNFQARQ